MQGEIADEIAGTIGPVGATLAGTRVTRPAFS